MSNLIDTTLHFLFRPTLNIMDVLVIMIIIPELMTTSSWFAVLIIPWLVYSIYMSYKYSGDY